MGCNCGGSAWTPTLVVDGQAAANGKRTGQAIGSGMFAHGDPDSGQPATSGSKLTDAK